MKRARAQHRWRKLYATVRRAAQVVAAEPLRSEDFDPVGKSPNAA